MLIISSLGGKTTSVDDLIKKLKKSTESDFLNCSDNHLAAFLNGLIIEKIGKKEKIVYIRLVGILEAVFVKKNSKVIICIQS